jgi:hypothetical protein
MTEYQIEARQLVYSDTPMYNSNGEKIQGPVMALFPIRLKLIVDETGSVVKAEKLVY